MFYFGSQSEGSTTPDLESDVDCLNCRHIFEVIQDLSDEQLQPDKVPLLMVQDETKTPGYCLLQLPFPDIPFLWEGHNREYITRDSRGRILMKHSILLHDQEGRIRHGPALAEQGVPNQYDNDVVPALFCSSWPKEAEPWLQQQNKSGWPTEDMKRYASEHGCFVVPVASRDSPNQDTEWRISYSHAERCLMFNINMTQLRCYILMKMILKTFFIPLCEDAVTSFMCKNVLFHCIGDSSASKWRDSNLITCLKKCILVLCNCISTENCPHFIIPRNNLLAGKLSSPVKLQLLEIMSGLIWNIEKSLLGISLDHLGYRLYLKSGGTPTGNMPSKELDAGKVIATLIGNTIDCYRKAAQNRTLKLVYHKHDVSVYQSLIQAISTLCQIYSGGSKMEQIACCYCTPQFCTSLGSIVASIGIYHYKTIFPEALMWFSAGLNSDISSGRLKLASALYCGEHNEQCESILAELSSRRKLIPVLSICHCNNMEKNVKGEFSRMCNEKNEEDVIKQNIAFCVTFLPSEIYCVPKELRYEFFRSTEQDRAYRGSGDYWMDWAAVDSLTYLHYMEYKVYTQLHRPVERHRALDNLVMTINTEPNLGHRETALNLLGQCMEQEHRLNAALCCYMMSLNERRRNNAAKWHICILFSRCFSADNTMTIKGVEREKLSNKVTARQKNTDTENVLDDDDCIQQRVPDAATTTIYQRITHVLEAGSEKDNKLKKLEEENSKLKRILLDNELEVKQIKEVASPSKKMNILDDDAGIQKTVPDAATTTSEQRIPHVLEAESEKDNKLKKLEEENLKLKRIQQDNELEVKQTKEVESPVKKGKGDVETNS